MNPRFRISTAALFAALVLLAAAPAAAQPYFDAPWRAFDATPHEWAQDALVCVAAGDLNGDGLADVVAGQLGGPAPGLPTGVEGVYVYLNQGDVAGPPATFAEAVFYELTSTPYDPQDIALADLDGDGDLDVAVASFDASYTSTGGHLAVFRNAGDGTLGAPTYFDAGIRGAIGVAAADLDGDGEIDLAATNNRGAGTTVSVFRNLGNATFAPRVAYETGALEPDRVAAGDLDGDGDADLVVGHGEPGRVSILFNDGTGAFGPATAYTGIFTGGNPGQYGSVALLDPDGDGDLDVAYSSTRAYSFTLEDSRLALLRNDGAGAFTLDYYAYELPFQDRVAIALTAADLDGDGLDDLLGAERGSAGDRPGFLVFHNDGAGGFLPPRKVASVAAVYDTAVADLDADGDPDAVSVNAFYPIIGAHENPGDGRFDVRPTFGSAFVHQVLDLGDVNHDGHVDAATSHSGAVSSTVNVYLGGGDGTFAQSYETPGSAYGYAKLRHLDGDGDLDLLFVSGPNAPPYDFFTAKGNGDGTFGPAVRWPVGTCGSAHPGAFDLDGDGDLDVVNTEDRGCSGEVFKFLYVSRNNGDGTFQPPHTLPLESATRNVAAGDFDEDGHLDLVTAWPSWTILFGAGNGTFGPEQPLPGINAGDNVLPLDLDDDGHLDLATLGTDPDAGIAHLLVLWGDGAGGFTATANGHHPVPSSRIWMDAGDVDADGDTDVLVDGVQDALVMVNDAGRAFRYDGRYGIGRASQAVHYADTDGDGVGDLVALVDVGFAENGLATVPGLAVVPTADAPVPVPAPAAPLALSAPRPNPATDRVAFTLALASAQTVRVEVFDALGRQVAVLHDGALSAGAHALALDAGRLAPGVYVVRATATDGASATRRVVVVR